MRRHRRALLGREPTDAEMREKEQHTRDLLLQLVEPTAATEAQREADMTSALTASLGRLPTDDELEAAREAAMRDRLNAQLGRTPTELEEAAARERCMLARLRAQNGGAEPTAEQIRTAREAALRAHLYMM